MSSHSDSTDFLPGINFALELGSLRLGMCGNNHTGNNPTTGGQKNIEVQFLPITNHHYSPRGAGDTLPVHSIAGLLPPVMP